MNSKFLSRIHKQETRTTSVGFRSSFAFLCILEENEIPMICIESASLRQVHLGIDVELQLQSINFIILRCHLFIHRCQMVGHGSYLFLISLRGCR